MNPQIPRFTQDSIKAHAEGFKAFIKIRATLARRIDGPFQCATQHGAANCTDGYLAIDDDGYPYPIAADLFERTYAPTGRKELVNGPDQ